MEVTRFTNEDFDVFTIDGLDPRMEALKMKIRPKLESLGQYFAPTLTTLTGDEMFVHVAKHARRTVHPPKDTWVAFANNPRGYKMLPHFQIGLWETHLFIWFAVIYEAPHKAEIGKRLSEKLAKIHKDIPKNFVWSMDHTKPETIQNETLSKEELQAMFDRLQTVKKAELLCGYVIDRNDAIQLNSEQLISKIQKVFESLTPLYNLAVKK
ncbi:YktB family protein [Bacillus sp. JJ1764]|uniref:YktB family protein n=1 Tax=Bacillus sp. JJ1764 TaxID=3122964 RepID=UPI002FFDEA2D